MDYSFNAEIAAVYGVEEAVFLHNLYWWIAKNEANGRHYYDGRNWTYNSMEAFAKLFPFWTSKQVRRIIKKLEAAGAIYIGNYNQKGFDRTQWYALSDEVSSLYQTGSSILPNGQMDVPKRANASDQMGRPIPDSKPYSKPDSINTPIVPTDLFVEFWKAYPKKVAKHTAQKAFEKLRPTRKLLDCMLEALAAQKQSPGWVKDGGQYIPNPATWLNQRRWEDETEEKPSGKRYGKFV